MSGDIADSPVVNEMDDNRRLILTTVIMNET